MCETGHRGRGGKGAGCGNGQGLLLHKAPRGALSQLQHERCGDAGTFLGDEVKDELGEALEGDDAISVGADALKEAKVPLLDLG